MVKINAPKWFSELDFGGTVDLREVEVPGPAGTEQVIVPKGAPKLPRQVNSKEVPMSAAIAAVGPGLTVVASARQDGGWAIAPSGVISDIQLPFKRVFKRDIED